MLRLNHAGAFSIVQLSSLLFGGAQRVYRKSRLNYPWFVMCCMTFWWDMVRQLRIPNKLKYVVRIISTCRMFSLCSSHAFWKTQTPLCAKSISDLRHIFYNPVSTVQTRSTQMLTVKFLFFSIPFIFRYNQMLPENFLVFLQKMFFVDSL